MLCYSRLGYILPQAFTHSVDSVNLFLSLEASCLMGKGVRHVITPFIVNFSSLLLTSFSCVCALSLQMHLLHSAFCSVSQKLGCPLSLLFETERLSHLPFPDLQDVSGMREHLRLNIAILLGNCHDCSCLLLWSLSI